MKFPKELKKPKHTSNSQLSSFRISPQHWLQYLKDKEKETKSSAIILGGLVHTMALQKEKLEKEYFLLDFANKPHPDKNFVNADNRDWKKAEIEAAGKKTVIDSDIMQTAKHMVEALYADDVARDLFQQGKVFEKPIQWKIFGLNCYGIQDISSPDFIAELKTTRNADPWAFQRDLFKLGYYRQGGMYLDGEMKGEMVGDPHKRFYFIAVENTEPYGVSVHELEEEVITFGVSEYRRLAQNLKDCITSDWFPSYQYRIINNSFDVFLPNYMLEV